MGYYITLADSRFTVDAKYAEKVSQELENHWYESIINESGCIDAIIFNGEKLGDAFEMFQRIAPMVDEGSYLQISGENGDLWRWVFIDGECYEIDAIITWPESSADAPPKIVDGDAIFLACQSQAGYCPVCGNALSEYGTCEIEEWSVEYPWTCEKCGHMGFEYGNIEFDGHKVLSYTPPENGGVS